MWLTTPHAEYAMALPHKTYADLWERSLNEMGPHWLAAKVGMWPTTGFRPSWWDELWSSRWPFEQPQGLKRRASQGPEYLGGQADGDISLLGEDQPTGRKWIRLGHKGDRSRPGEPRSHLHHLSPWRLEPDSGMLPSIAPLKSGQGSTEES